ncbi:MAG: hypothetical protein BWZ08_02225 [candidate division BRC1 bacterium ADurb.BinA292]|nr:MAG: hypothetical protein BWZ08_02225 [candidate division BRC1 bacterium ADurb.BinA292]
MSSWRDKAIELLEPSVFDGDPLGAGADYVPDLIECYLQTGRTARAAEAMNVLLRPGAGTRARVWRAVEAYRRIDPFAADRLWERIRDVMAAPVVQLPLPPAPGEVETAAAD